MVSCEEALEICHEAGRSGSFSIADSARARELVQTHSPADVRSVLATAASCTQEEEHFVVQGTSLDGQNVSVRVVIHAGALSVV